MEDLEQRSDIENISALYTKFDLSHFSPRCLTFAYAVTLSKYYPVLVDFADYADMLNLEHPFFNPMNILSTEPEHSFAL